MRKRTLEGHSKSHSVVDSKFFDCISKSSESSGLSCCSSSSDDELSQLSSLELSRQRDDKHDRDSECKMSRQELYRQLMLGEYDLSSSPDFDSFSPSLFEERGLPVEIRYQLPLALGTANETEKECTICQLHYGIGDHIVTLPCQHFFHACCVDKWLWNHTSCPLCRTEVTLDGDSEQFSLKHRFNECSQSDQEAIRRKMRSSSHSAGFRPVVPANVEVDQLQTHLSGMSIQEETTESNNVKYLVCPRPQRAQPQ
ncbi:hypothetical protein Poli38472_000647 [Pythium oligandrum]|uniref:RING-type domain-containing protein n=1 Tax=Pythium oligandrum TaxID=41045 RepID=A0A8K1CD44_PYTOL|nr:hypothetical protein Poli38472_000647 [Pythium oligandrum]|eukprot:TMW60605.1 hypothetical protein Poli38472_000647 [Pythium oligandrum]